MKKKGTGNRDQGSGRKALFDSFKGRKPVEVNIGLDHVVDPYSMLDYFDKYLGSAPRIRLRHLRGCAAMDRGELLDREPRQSGAARVRETSVSSNLLPAGIR